MATSKKVKWFIGCIIQDSIVVIGNAGDLFYSASSYRELFCGLQVRSLLGTSVEWLYFILQAFNAGDLTKYQELCGQYQSALTAQPALVENEKKLWEKINILCLMELIFR